MTTKETKEIKVLVKNESKSYSSETITWNGNKSKIVAENGNAYSKLQVYVYKQDGDLGLIATSGDIAQYIPVNYIWDDAERLRVSRYNIKVAESYIKKVF